MSETACFLHDLIQISRDGTEFYEEAARTVSDKKLSKVFTDMAKAKTTLADNLSIELKPGSKPGAKSMDLVDEVGQAYAGIGRGMKAVNSAHITAME